MKTKIISTLLVAVVAWCGGVQAQTNTTEGQPAPVPVVPAPAEQSGQAVTNPPPAAGETTTQAPMQTPAAVTPAVSESAAGAVPVKSSLPAAASVGAGEESLIQINPSTSLPDAIQVLARMAGINYQFDPRIINQTAPDGRPLPPPTVGVEIRWEKITAAQALTALLDNYGWQMIQDPQSKIARVTIKDPASLDPLVTKVIQLKYSSPTNIQSQLMGTLSKRSAIIADMRTSQLVVMTTEKELNGLEALIEKLDGSTKQVLIEAKLLETTKNPTSVKGIDWSDTLAGQNVTFGNGTTTGTSVETTQPTTVGGATGGNASFPSTIANVASRVTTLTTTLGAGGITADTAHGFSPSTAFLSADGVHAVLSFLNTDAETESLALPRSVAQDGVETELAVIRNVPIFEQQQSAGGTGQNNLVSAMPNYEKKVSGTVINEVGVKLRVTPRIVGLTNVWLDLKPEISAQELLPAHVVLSGQVNEAPIFSRRRISTQATVPSGYTLVLGGLNNDNTSKTFTKVPFLGDIPGIGLLFRHDSKERTKQNLMIFVTPTIIGDADFQLTKTEFLKNKYVPKPDTEESPWDTGKPKDWTKPKKTEPDYQVY